MQYHDDASPYLTIGTRRIGPAFAPYIIAEIGVNHDGDPARALALTELAIACGADAVKFQYFSADLLVARPTLRLADGAGVGGEVVGKRLAAYQAAAGETDPHAMLARLELSLDVMAQCIERIHAARRHAMVTIFSQSLVLRASKLPWDVYKTASPDIIHRPLLEAVARLGKPMIVSTGAAEFSEVQQALGWLDEQSLSQPSWSTPAHIRTRLALLQCVSSYPCAPQDAAVAGIEHLATLHPIVGYSDHTTQVDTGALAVRHGAVVLEKHITDDCSRKGPDHSASLDAPAFARYVQLARAVAGSVDSDSSSATADQRLGTRHKSVQPCEVDVRAVSRQSIVAIRSLPAGHVLSAIDLTFKRPGSGLAPFEVREVIGQVLNSDVQADQPLTPALFSDLRPTTTRVATTSGSTGVARV